MWVTWHTGTTYRTTQLQLMVRMDQWISTEINPPPLRFAAAAAVYVYKSENVFLIVCAQGDSCCLVIQTEPNMDVCRVNRANYGNFDVWLSPSSHLRRRGL